MEILFVANTGVISRLQRALGVLQANEASCSSESTLSWLQMGQLGDDEKLWEGGPKRSLCIVLASIWDKRTPAIQFNIKTKIIWHLQKMETCCCRLFQNLLKKRSYATHIEAGKLIHNIQSGLGSLLNVRDIPICIKYSLFLCNKFLSKLEKLK